MSGRAMTPDEFQASLPLTSPAAGMPPLLLALWHDAHGQWHDAHAITQGLDGADAAWLHAYLHRKEGDAGNAAYWYQRAGRDMPECSLDAEWRALATAFATRSTRLG